MRIHSDHSEPRIFVIGHDTSLRDYVKKSVPEHCDRTEWFSDLTEYQQACQPTLTGCVVFEARPDNNSSADHQLTPLYQSCQLPILVLCHNATVAMSVHAVKRGAFNFLEQPSSPQILNHAVTDAVAWSETKYYRTRRRQEFEQLKATLSPREEQVYELLLQGQENKRIALALQISPSTVEKHRLSVVRKMGTENAVQLLNQKFEATGSLAANSAPPKLLHKKAS